MWGDAPAEDPKAWGDKPIESGADWGDAPETGATLRGSANAFLRAGQAGVGRMLEGAAAAYELPAPTVESPDVPPMGRKFSVGPGGLLIYEPTEAPSVTRARTERNPVFIAGQALEQTAPEVHPVPPGEENALPTQVAGMAGGFVPVLATGPLAPIAMGAQSMGEHVTTDYEKAKAAGLSDDDAAQQAVERGMASGALQAAIFEFLPKPLRSAAEKYLVDKFGQEGFARWLSGRAAAAGEGAALGASSQAAENVVEGRPVGENVGPSAGGLAASNLLFPWLRETATEARVRQALEEPPAPPEPGGTTVPVGETPTAPAPSLASLPVEPTLVRDALAEARNQPPELSEADLADLEAAMKGNQAAGPEVRPAPGGEPPPESLTPEATGATRDLAAPETETGGTAGTETTSETPTTSTPAELAAPPAIESGTIPVEGSQEPRSAAALRTRQSDLAAGKRGWDLIDEAQERFGTIDPTLIKEADPNWKPVGAARKLFRVGGERADVAATRLSEAGIYRGDPGQVDQLAQEINQAALGRIGDRQEASRKAQQDRQEEAFARDSGRPGPNQRVMIADDLQPGDRLKIRGAPLTVRHLEFDEDGRVTGVVLDDGAKYGTREVPGGTELQVDKRSYRKSEAETVTVPIGEGKQRTRLARGGETGEPAKSGLEAWADEVLAGGATHGGPDVFAAYIVKGAYVIGRIAKQVALSFRDFTTVMINELGRDVIPHLEKIWPEALKLRAQQVQEELASAKDEASRKSLEREAKDIETEAAKLTTKSAKGTETPELQKRAEVSNQEAAQALRDRQAQVTGRINELNQAEQRGQLTGEMRSERYQLAKESRELERRLAQNPEHVADLLRRMDQLGQQMELSRKAGNGLGVREAGEELRGLMEGELQRVPHELFARVYNDLVAKGEIMGSNRPELPAGRTLGELVAWLKGQKLDSPRLTMRERFNLAQRLADRWSKGRDAFAHFADRMSAMWEAFKDQYKAPPLDDDFRRTVKEWFYQKQWTGLETHRWVQAIEHAVPSKVRRQGISAWLEAGGNEALLREQLALVPDKFKGIWKAALELTTGERAIANRIRTDFETKLEDAKTLGLLDKGRQDYGVPQVWQKLPQREGAYDPSEPAGRGQAPPRRPGAKLDPRQPFFALERTNPSYFDGIMAGGEPKDMDVSKLVGVYNAEMHNSLADRSVIKALKDAKDKEGNPIVQISGSARVIPRGEPGSGERTYFIDPNWRDKDAVTKDGRPYRTVDHWALRDWKFASRDAEGNPVLVRGDFLVHPDYVGFLKNELGQSWLRDKEGGGKYFNWLLNSAAFLKASKFASATFHLATIGEHAMFHAVLPVSKGVELDPARDPKLAGLMRNGLELGFGQQRDLFEEGLSSHGGLWGQVPGVAEALGKMSDFLFKRYIPAMKVKVGEAVLERNLARYKGKLSEDQIYELTASQVNAAFGLQNWRLMGTNKTLLDVNRLLFTAPDFLLSRAKVVGQALKPYGREQRYFLLAQAGLVYLASRALNLVLDGDPHWEPENALSVVYNGRAYSARFLVNDIYNMAMDFKGDHPGWNFLSGRLGPAPRAAYEAVTGRDMRTGARASVPVETDNKALRAAEVLLKGVAQWLVPMGVEGLLPGAAGREQTGPGQVALALVGVGSRKYTARTQMYQMAADFNRNGDQAAQTYQRQQDSESKGESAYRKLDDLLAAGELDRAGKEYDSLVNDEGHRPLAIAQHYGRVGQPFTGNRAREAQFKASLTPAQLETYQKAVQERIDLRDAFGAMMRSRQTATVGAE